MSTHEHTPRCAVAGCENPTAWRRVVRLATGSLVFYYYCVEHLPEATKTDQAETVRIEPVDLKWPPAA